MKLSGDEATSENRNLKMHLKFIYSEKATKFCKIPTLIFPVCTVDSKVESSQNFVAFSEYTNFTIYFFTILLIYVKVWFFLYSYL